jgi:hypothetical protein
MTEFLYKFLKRIDTKLGDIPISDSLSRKRGTVRWFRFMDSQVSKIET